MACKRPIKNKACEIQMLVRVARDLVVWFTLVYEPFVAGIYSLFPDDRSG